MADSVTFSAQIKSLQSRILATGDKGGRLVFEFNVLDDELIGQLARFVTVDSEVSVTVQKAEINR